MPHRDNSDFGSEPAGLIASAGIGAIERLQKQSNAELVKALREGESPRRQEYRLLVANGHKLVYHCLECNQDMVFPPELGGELAKCIHCNAAAILLRKEEMKRAPCPRCNAIIEYYDTSCRYGRIRLNCAKCGHSYNPNAKEEAELTKMRWPGVLVISLVFIAAVAFSVYFFTHL